MAVTPAWIAQRARHHGLDADATLRVASAEGLSGGIGDGGHAFGPFQLNNAGGVITGKFPGWSNDQIQQWAWSPEGVDYALAGIARVARGLSGPAAVTAIVNRFERPANPGAEISRALGRTSMATGGASRMTVPQPTQPAQTDISPLLVALLAHRTPVQPFAPSAPVFPSVASAAPTAAPVAAPTPVTAFRAPALAFATPNVPSLLRPLA